MFIHSRDSLLVVAYAPGQILGNGDLATKQKGKASVLMELRFIRGCDRQ